MPSNIRSKTQHVEKQSERKFSAQLLARVAMLLINNHLGKQIIIVIHVLDNKFWTHKYIYENIYIYIYQEKLNLLWLSEYQNNLFCHYPLSLIHQEQEQEHQKQEHQNISKKVFNYTKCDRVILSTAGTYFQDELMTTNRTNRYKQSVNSWLILRRVFGPYQHANLSL